jgi:hypothetical protein
MKDDPMRIPGLNPSRQPSSMARREFLGLMAAGSSMAFVGTGFAAEGGDSDGLDLDLESTGLDEERTGRKLNPNTRWMLEARWGLFSHLLPPSRGAAGGPSLNADEWNRRVDDFKVEQLAGQLSALGVKYYFLTAGSNDRLFCSPNTALAKLPGCVASKRDLIADLAKALAERGIRMGVSLPAFGAGETRDASLAAITEWSKRWGKSVSAWWIDDAKLPDEKVYDAYADAVKAGNPDALVAFNTGPLTLTYRLQEPPTEREDFFAGEVDYYLPTCAVRSFDKKEFWVGPNFHGALVHFITFLGSGWGVGDPRFPDDLVKGWTRHTNNYQGAVTWDVPLEPSGTIPESHFKQIMALSEYIAS